MKLLLILSLLGFLPAATVFGFVAVPAKKSLHENLALMLSRRDVVNHISVCTLALIGTVTLPHGNARASGGATAGGAYLLSAKQRYNDRVKQGVKTFASLTNPLDSGDIEVLRSFFTSEDVGSWKDFSAAGYLLANAFRRNSSAAPDSLPAVKKWKAFAANVEGMTKSLKKKDTKGAKASFDAAISSLDSYLAEVDLPLTKEIAN
ncbi:hypothetical protein FisN_1Lh641 [Fistulifera solaris]|uniref:Uncharacterized protein n=1 Tax=Fistulifera solaris TaxID=1519565 RepID=A0A1Z5K182_FISSO|nr:hypothetical protein FisN_1Lh641 [Fistulifera solaris]|eukprot:GAX19892.1 hypothetical protein FisN_1Lh641 [Fistulifera solaris]